MGKSMSGFKTLLEPRSVAVVGASESEGKAGNIVLGNIIRNGFDGPVYPVNPGATRILGRKSYPDLLSIPEPPGAVFILLPAERVVGAIRQCAERNAEAVVIVSSGFGEVGGPGVRAQAEIVEIMKRAGIRGIGPNTVGFINSYDSLFASFLPVKEWHSGPVAIAAQTGNFSGCLADEIMSRETQRIGIGITLSMGNKVDLDEADFLEYAHGKPEVDVVALHLESIKRPHLFMETAASVKRDKPVIVLKPGRTEAGARAAASHTGSLAAEDLLVEAAMRQAGLIRAYTVEEFLEYMKVGIHEGLLLPAAAPREQGRHSHAERSGGGNRLRRTLRSRDDTFTLQCKHHQRNLQAHAPVAAGEQSRRCMDVDVR
jgi:acetyltransferase